MKELISFIFRVIGGKIRNAYDKLFLVCSICLWTLVYSCCELKKLADSVHFPINLTYTEKYSSASGGAKTNCIQIAAAIGSGFFCRMLQQFEDASASPLNSELNYASILSVKKNPLLTNRG